MNYPEWNARQGLEDQITTQERERIQKESGLGAKLAAEGQVAMGMAGSRQSARNAILDYARGLADQADELIRLANSLPAEMNPAADRALYDLVFKVRYRP